MYVVYEVPRRQAGFIPTPPASLSMIRSFPMPSGIEKSLGAQFSKALEDGLFQPATESDKAAAPSGQPRSEGTMQNPMVFNPNPAAYNPNPMAFNPNPAAYNPNPMAFNPNPADYNPNPAFNANALAFNPNPAAYNPNPVFYHNGVAFNPNPAAYNPNAMGA